MKIIDIVSFALTIFFISTVLIFLIYLVSFDNDCSDEIADNSALKTLIEIISLLFIAYVMGNFIVPVYLYIKRILILFIE